MLYRNVEEKGELGEEEKKGERGCPTCHLAEFNKKKIKKNKAFNIV